LIITEIFTASARLIASDTEASELTEAFQNWSQDVPKSELTLLLQTALPLNNKADREAY